MSELIELEAAWIAAEQAVSAQSARMYSAVRDRPPYKDRARYEEYQARVMVPLIAERDELRAAAKAAKQAMFEAAKGTRL